MEPRDRPILTAHYEEDQEEEEDVDYSEDLPKKELKKDNYLSNS